jgi:hypothetical protein
MTAPTPADELSSFGAFLRFPVPVRRPPVCRLDGSSDQRCRLTVRRPDGQEETVFDVPVQEIDRVTFTSGRLAVRVRGRTHHVALATPRETTLVRTASLSTFHQAGGCDPRPRGSSAVVIRAEQTARETVLDPRGLRWLRWFAARGVHVETLALWKPRVRSFLTAVYLTVLLVVGVSCAVGVAEEGAGTEARGLVVGASALVVLASMLYAAAVSLLRVTARRDTAQRLGGGPGAPSAR